MATNSAPPCARRLSAQPSRGLAPAVFLQGRMIFTLDSEVCCSWGCHLGNGLSPPQAPLLETSCVSRFLLKSFTLLWLRLLFGRTRCLSCRWLQVAQAWRSKPQSSTFFMAAARLMYLKIFCPSLLTQQCACFSCVRVCLHSDMCSSANSRVVVETEAAFLFAKATVEHFKHVIGKCMELDGVKLSEYVQSAG